jgi:hypothetical protein
MFTKAAVSADVVWEPTPDDQSAHDWLLAHLRRMQLPFEDGPITPRIQGNLGECCCWLIGGENDSEGLSGFVANAHQPLQDISQPESDIVWVALASNPLDDWVALQEVKTTGSSNLNYASHLVTDYEKLFGPDLALTLSSAPIHRAWQERTTSDAARSSHAGDRTHVVSPENESTTSTEQASDGTDGG